MIRNIIKLFLAILVLGGFVLVISMFQKKQVPPSEFNMEAPLPEYIGVATMKPDGTIVLRLRMQLPEGVGDGQQEYSTRHPQYTSILAHIGELKPGQTVSVRPWPEESK